MIVFNQFNYTKPDGFMLFYCQILLNFQGAYALMHVRSLRLKDFLWFECENIAGDHETRRKIKTTACGGVRRYRQARSEKSKIRAGESLLRGFLSGLHFRTDRIIQNQQIDDAASRRRHLVPIKIASAKVSPSETQPGRSGTTTVQSSFSSQG